MEDAAREKSAKELKAKVEAKAEAPGVAQALLSSVQTMPEKKVHMKLNLDVMAPLILAPASISIGQNVPIVILDLGHLVITHDSGPPEDIVDYTYFFIQLDRIGAYVQNTDTAPLPLGAIINPFSIDFNIGTKAVQGKPDLPTTTVKGQLEEFHVCVTTEKLKDILRVVTSIQPPPQKKDEDILVHQKRSLKMQRRGNRLTESVGSYTAQAAADWSRLSLAQSNPERAASFSNIRKSKEKEATLALSFNLGKVTVLVRDKPEENLPEGQALVKASIKALNMDVQMSSWDTSAAFTLDRQLQ